MILYPALDLLKGKVVRLEKGDFSKLTTYESDPLKIAMSYEAEGATHLHVVDLDGAKEGECRQMELIKSIVRQTNLKVQVGGGIRSDQDIAQYLEMGVDRVVIGSMAVAQPDTVLTWVRLFGAERFVIALDCRLNNGRAYVATYGWRETSRNELWPLLTTYAAYSVHRFIVTDIDRDGLLNGPNHELYRLIKQTYPSNEVIASGGTASDKDVLTLNAIPVFGVIIGKALFEKKINLSHLLREVSHAR